MPKKLVTPEIAKIIRASYLNYPSRVIASQFGFSHSVVLRYLRENNLKVPEDVIRGWQKLYRPPAKEITSADRDYIIANIETHTVKQIALSLKISVLRLRPVISELGLDPIVLAKKLASRIQPGTPPPNKGKKISEFMNPQQIAIFKGNQFKAGSIPHNAIPEGQEVERKDKTGRIYILIKIAGQKRLLPKHRYVWEQHHKKKVPKRHKITFKDGNTFNCDIENLECISYEKQMIQNSLHQYPQELKGLMYLKGSITRQINKHAKRNNP